VTDWIEIRVPQDQEEDSTATLASWLNEIGDEVEQDEAVAELETDKVNVEITAPADGILAEILVEEGAEVTPGLLLARMAPPGTELGETERPRTEPAEETSTRKRQVRRGSGGEGSERLSPVVRRLLREHGLRPEQVEGTGAEGRITREDVLDHVARVNPDRTTRPDVPRINAANHRVPHDRMRRNIAAHMSESLRVAPHVTAVFEADLTAITTHREANKDSFADRGAKLTFTAYFVAAAVEAMRAVPEVNASFEEDALVVFDDVNIGVGTALADKGLIVPVIHGAQDLDLFGIAKRLTEATARARNGKLEPDDVKNGTFTISNHGVSGSLIAAPIIINQPQVAILGIGKLEKRVVVVEGEGGDTMAIRPRVFVSLSIDHRALDAHHTNAWLTRFVEVIETWK